MNRDDFVKLVGVASDNDHYVPVAFYSAMAMPVPDTTIAVNKGLTGTCVLLNAR